MTELSPGFIHAALKRLYEQSFYDFVQAAWEHVDNATFKPNWHIEAICLHLQALVEGRIPSRRLLINVPPGAGKSRLCNVLLPAWCWAIDPKKQIINTSFATDQSGRDTQASRDLITGEWFQSFWPIKLKDDQNQKGKYGNTKGGLRELRPYSNITGSRANLVIVDDPQSAAGANSAAERAEAVRVFWGSVQTRINDPAKDAIICIMQRLHEEDVAGSILAKNESLKPGQLGYYEHLCIPMEYDGNDRMTCIGWRDPRIKIGELMFPAQMPPDYVAALKSGMGPIAYSGQCQQTPAPATDGFLRKEWFHTYGSAPCEAEVNGEPCGKVHRPPAHLRRYMVSDHAPGGTSTHDYNVIRVWGVDTSRNIWLLDSFRKQCTMNVAMGVQTDHGRTVLASEGALPLIRKFREAGTPISGWFAENDNTWKAIQSQVRTWMLDTGTFCTIHPLPTAGDKMQKAQPYQALASMGKVYLPEGMVGETALLEYMMFPVGKHDDQVDADGMIARCMQSAHPAVAPTAAAMHEAEDYQTSSGHSDGYSDTSTFYY